jgi:hypothetical protein
VNGKSKSQASGPEFVHEEEGFIRKNRCIVLDYSRIVDVNYQRVFGRPVF